ncbi:transmembrane protein, putative [Medicago truncatula]|uniref:Transmembrane protein, putative n=1 Tax=Medicago truncatula TaxID=3880 RepID=A0A072TKW0_MEDTR|nr:transmembrane protein, putative [Medicago truncatula]
MDSFKDARFTELKYLLNKGGVDVEKSFLGIQLSFFEKSRLYQSFVAFLAFCFVMRLRPFTF